MKKTLLVLTLALSTMAATDARADGLPLPVDESGTGVLSDDGAIRFLAASARGRTAVIDQDTRDGSLIAGDILRGRFSIPLVSYDGTAGGLSGDERTLVLIRPRTRFPRTSTSFAVVRVDRARRLLRVSRRVHLRGDFSFDALSPDGRALFLINYISRRNPNRYRVRVFDLRRGVLARAAVVDPREDPDEMNGFPVTRVMSRDDRWAYTLYQGNEHPFIHALDTVHRKAACIDLDDVRGDPRRLSLDAADPAHLGVRRGKRLVRVVDTRTFEVSEPQDAAAERKNGLSWPMPAGLVALLAGAYAARRVRAPVR